MRLSNGILTVTLALGALVVPGSAWAKNPADATKVDAKPVCAPDKTCSPKLTSQSAEPAKAKNLKPAPVEANGSVLSLTTRPAHPRR